MSRSLAARIVAAPVLSRPRQARVTVAEWLAAVQETAPGLADLVAPRSRARALLAGLADHSPYLWGLVTADPGRVARLLAADPDLHVDDLFRRLDRDLDASEDDDMAMAALRRAKSEAALLVALADIGGVWPVPQVTNALTCLAERTVSGAVRHLLRGFAAAGKLRPPDPADPEWGSGLVVLAMGKGGAGELNYSSDLDLIIFFDPDAPGLAPGVEAQDLFVRLTRRLVKLFQERTADGYVFRLDLRLRPDPGSTQAAVSLGTAFHYYETRGQTWERAAFIKACPVAGDRHRAAQVLRDLSPFVWRRFLDYAAIADVHDMKRRIHAFRGHEEIAAEGHNVKLGRGGIREIEFFVQTQQLIAGGRHPALRGRSTLAMLDALCDGGWISPTVRDDLTEAYLFLRAVEHRLQMVGDEQTHELPRDPEAFADFARFMGFADRDAFAEVLVRHLGKVQRHYARLFEDAPAAAAARAGLVMPKSEDAKETVQALARAGFADPVGATRTMLGWRSYRGLRSEAASELLDEVGPALVSEIAKSENRDQAFAALDRVLAGLPHGVRLLSRLRHNPDLVSLIARAIGAAPRIADIIARRPQALDVLFDPAFFGALPDAAALHQRVLTVLSEASGYEDFLDRARWFSQEQQVLVALRVLSGTAPAAQAGPAFAQIADAVIHAVHDAVGVAHAAAHGLVAGQGTAVIALGKLGSREMTATSDLDLMLLYSFDHEHPESDGERPLYGAHYFARFTQRLISALTAQTNYGALYDVDMRLRPSGRSGPVATEVAGFLDYQRREAWTWEHMALTRARVVAGDPATRDAATEAIREVLCTPRDRRRVARDVAEMRRAIADDKGEDRPWDLKYAAGGLVDVEFLAQYLALVHAHEAPDILDTSTIGVLTRAQRLGVLAQEDGEVLRRAGRLWQDLTQITRLALPGSFDPAQAGPDLLALLAKAGDAPDFAALEADMRDTRSRVRAIFTRLLKP